MYHLKTASKVAGKKNNWAKIIRLTHDPKLMFRRFRIISHNHKPGAFGWLLFSKPILFEVHQAPSATWISKQPVFKLSNDLDDHPIQTSFFKVPGGHAPPIL